jgi:hypothetical protein
LVGDDLIKLRSGQILSNASMELARRRILPEQ